MRLTIWADRFRMVSGLRKGKRAHNAAGAGAIVIIAAIFGVACSEQLTHPNELSVGVSVGAVGARMIPGPATNAVVTADERDAIDAIARAMAAALRDPSIRQEIKAALAGSAITEHKLDFNSFIEGRGGNIIAAAARTGQGSAFAAASGRGFAPSSSTCPSQRTGRAGLVMRTSSWRTC